MPYNRLNNAGEILKKMKAVEKFSIPLTSPTVDATAAAIAVDDAVMTVATFASWATGDYFFVNGTGRVELNQLGTKPGSSAPIPVVRPFLIAQASGAVISKVTRSDMGYIEDGGATLTGSKTKTGIGAANAGGSIAYIDGDTPELGISWSQRESNLRNILTSFGVDEDSIKGTGTSPDPYRCLISADAIGTQANLCYRLSGLMDNGKTQYFDILNATPEVNVSAVIVAKGQPTVWGIAVKFTDMAIYIK